MASEFISLAVIAAVAAASPVIARVIPRQIVPETVLLIAAGTVLGPNMLGAIESGGDAIKLLSELGCAFLFLLAGYEIDPKALMGADGKHGLATWVATFGIAVVYTLLLPSIATGSHGLVAASLLLTTTALGALMPILKDRGLSGTRVGDLVISYGTWGELGPVLAMAVLLSTRATWQTAVILLILFALCVAIATVATKSHKRSTALYRFLESKSNGTSQTMLRLAVVMLISLVAFSAIFDLDIVLGAFAAGFVMRAIAPDGTPELEAKLDGMAYGFFVPLFFVVSGSKIDLSAVAGAPLMLALFILGLVLVRTVPIVVSLSLRKATRNEVTMHNRLATAFYCTTALPLIVAITSVAVDGGMMEPSTASVLVAAGALTVFLMPFLGAIAYRVADAEPIAAVREIVQDHQDARTVFREHAERERERAHAHRAAAKRRVYGSINAIPDPEERKAAFDLADKHAGEMRDLARRQRDEIIDLYSSFHQDNPPGDEERRRLLDLAFKPHSGR
ncbi:cation:proton antiporter [Curtanaerobium respiraculi]|uniref:cation:proton antiporter n=1 Tax=Curtanaerobium respiraculi TaxID=2949669 RepID=UPI0024B3B41F|nr:cation:proton antiporter [Curtanaerobium respiraculi]